MSTLRHQPVRPNPETGFTLVEALIAALLLIIVVGGGFAALSAFGHRAAAFTESGELEDRRSVIMDTLQTDVDRAGWNLSLTNTYGAGVEAATFIPDPYYTSSAGTLTKSGPSGWNDVIQLTRYILQGTASFSASLPPNSQFVIDSSETPTSQRAIFIGPASSPVISIYENGVSVTIVGTYQNGDGYRIAQELTSTGAWTANYYMTRGGAESLLYASTKPPLAYPITGYVALYDTGASASNLQVSGSVLADKQPPVVLPPLPMDTATGARLTEPFTITMHGSSLSQAVMIAGDPDVDPVYLQTSYNTAGTPISLQVTTPRRGTLAAGDYALLMDPHPATRGCCLYRISSVTPGPSLTSLTMDAMTGSGALATAWGRLYSPSSDYSRAYPPGSALVRLLPLVTYTLANGLLTRTETYRSGITEGQKAATVSPGITAFQMQAVSVGTIRAYNVSVTAATEGVDTGTTTEDLNFTLVPRALARPGEWISQMQ